MEQKSLPLSIVISALIEDEKILLIKRKRGNFVGFWGIPGGKIEQEEHLCEAAIREISEETGVDCIFVDHVAVISEHIIDGENKKHFILHICELKPNKEILARETEEGELKWFDLGSLYEENIIPSDLEIIEKIIKSREKNYFKSVIEKKEDDYNLVKFE